MRKPIPYGRQHIDDNDLQAVAQVLQGDFLTQGPAVAEFEQNFAAYCGSAYAVAVANGTAALHLCTLALGVDQSSTVITTPITFAASANCVLYCGGTIDFADIDAHNGLIDLEALQTKLERAPSGTYSGVIPVDFAGHPVNLEALKKLANKHNLWIIEDACHAPGGGFMDSKNQMQRCGNGQFADLAIFSFHPVKHIATGEGGMITTNNKGLYEKLLMLRTHGITKDPTLMHENHGGWYYEMQELGFNYRLSDIQAALGNSQLQKADAGMKRRHEIAKVYDNAFSEIKTIRPLVSNRNVLHAYHLYVIRTPFRKELYDFLRQKQIFTQVHYIPVHRLPYYKSYGWKQGDFPNAEKYYEECLSLPMFPSLTDEEQQYVIDSIMEFVAVISTGSDKKVSTL